MAQPVARDRQEPPVAGTIQQHLRNRQADQLGVGDPRRPAATTARQQEVISQDVESDEERVEAGGHGASKVNDARTPPVFDTPPPAHPAATPSIRNRSSSPALASGALRPPQEKQPAGFTITPSATRTYQPATVGDSDT
jgi:hypothetical protein